MQNCLNLTFKILSTNICKKLRRYVVWPLVDLMLIQSQFKLQEPLLNILNEVIIQFLT